MSDQNQAATQPSYFNLLVEGVGYLNRVRTVKPKKGQEFLACSLGYRAKYVLAAARMVASGVLDLDAIAALPDDALFSALLTVPGVGEKVANCVMLFGYHRLSRFPRDVWIIRIEEREYGGLFPLERYPFDAGALQQYIFYYARSAEYAAQSAMRLPGGDSPKKT